MKHLVFVINSSSGGGAERVIALLAESAEKHGYSPIIIFTRQKLSDAILYNKKINYISLEDCFENDGMTRVHPAFTLFNLIYRFFSKFSDKVPEKLVILRYKWKNTERIKCLQTILSKYPNAPIIAFLDEPILLTLLSTHGHPIIISERNNVSLHDGDVRGNASIDLLYKKASAIVCQTQEAADFYRERVPTVDRRVILNPLSGGLPEPYHGERQKKIVNFCRISPQKNLILLVDAFNMVVKVHPEYSLYIIGACSEWDKAYFDTLKEHISSLGIGNRICFMDFQPDVHEFIRSFAMFVSSSDYEGLSNSMLEAMAIGLPVVCTDCQGGGARMMIKDHENGLLVPMQDPDALANAMNEIIENPELSEILARNGTVVRKQLEKEMICAQWYETITKYSSEA